MHVSFCTFLSVHVFVSLWYLVVAFWMKSTATEVGWIDDDYYFIFLCKYMRHTMKHSNHFNVHVHLSDLVIPNYIIRYSVFSSKMEKKVLFFLWYFVLNPSTWWYKAPVAFLKIPFLMFPAIIISKNDQSCNQVPHIFMQHIHNAKYFRMGQPEKCYLCFKHKEQTRRKEGKTDSAHHVYL